MTRKVVVVTSPDEGILGVCTSLTRAVQYAKAQGFTVDLKEAMGLRRSELKVRHYFCIIMDTAEGSEVTFDEYPLC
jgi:hypothetical protein